MQYGPHVVFVAPSVPGFPEKEDQAAEPITRPVPGIPRPAVFRLPAPRACVNDNPPYGDLRVEKRIPGLETCLRRETS